MNMNRLLGIMAVTIAFTACQSKVDYKKVRDDVMKFHDVAMNDHGLVVTNQMKLDTLLKDLKRLKAVFPEVDTLKEKANITAMIAQLGKAENDMNEWMHKFEPDITGKSSEAAVSYFEAEKIKIAAIDSVYKKEIAASNVYLNKFRK